MHSVIDGAKGSLGFRKDIVLFPLNRKSVMHDSVIALHSPDHRR